MSQYGCIRGSCDSNDLMIAIANNNRNNMIAIIDNLFQRVTRVTWCSTSRDSLTDCIPGDWSCQCPQCRYGDVLMADFYIYCTTVVHIALSLAASLFKVFRVGSP
jgi:hypothetical protein